MTQTNRWRASPLIQTRAQKLRRELTPAERKLWQHLRGRQLEGAFFRRQHAVGRFILDFFCAKAKLVIELDGPHHFTPEQTAYDAERTRWLNKQKHYRVIRFTNAEVMNNMEGVLAKIREELKA